MIRKLKSLVNRILGRKGRRAGGDPEGVRYYDPNSEMSFQGYFEENKEAIFRGEVPARYLEIADMVPGARVLEIGSADGTQALVLAQQKEEVHGLELMPQQYRTSLELKDAWLGLGKEVVNCHFHLGEACSKPELLDMVDTILMSRVIYHLRSEIPKLFQQIKDSGIKNLVMIGCPDRERRWLEGGETADAMGKYAYFASQEGMEALALDNGFEVVRSIPSAEGSDPMVFAARK